MAIRAGRSKDWDRRWEMGHTASSLWEQPYDNDDPMTFTCGKPAAVRGFKRPLPRG